MDLSISRRRKQLNRLTRDNKRLLPNQVRVPSVLRAPRSCACWDCDARQRRSARQGCRGGLDRVPLFPRAGVSRAAQSATAAGEDTLPAHCARAPAAEKARSSDKNRTFKDGLYSINRNLFRFIPSNTFRHARRRPVLAIPRMRLPLDSGTNYLLTALTNAFNSLSCASCPLTPNWKTILSRPAAIRAEVRSRVYWTNVLIDTKVSVTFNCLSSLVPSPRPGAHISLVLREMSDTADVDRQAYRMNRESEGRCCGIPHLAKNERDVGHPALAREPEAALTRRY